VGRLLKQAREARGLSLEQMTRLTRIRESYLVALEAGDLEHLPGHAFVIGFLRLYARQLGLPEESLVAPFQELPAPRVDERVQLRLPRPVKSTYRGRSGWGSAVAGIVFFAALFAIYERWTGRPQPAPAALDTVPSLFETENTSGTRETLDPFERLPDPKENEVSVAPPGGAEFGAALEPASPTEGGQTSQETPAIASFPVTVEATEDLPRASVVPPADVVVDAKPEDVVEAEPEVVVEAEPAYQPPIPPQKPPTPRPEPAVRPFREPEPAFGRLERKPEPEFGRIAREPEPAFGRLERKPEPEFGRIAREPEPTFGRNAREPEPAFGRLERKPEPEFGRNAREPEGFWNDPPMERERPRDAERFPERVVEPERPVREASPPPAPPGPPITLVATKKVWVQIWNRNRKMIKALVLYPGEELRLPQEGAPFEATLGNAGGVEFRVGGRGIPPLGADGQVLTRVAISAQSLSGRGP
jgi:cytoskeletal protein RodZ